MTYSPDLERRLRELEQECANLRRENAHLRSFLGAVPPSEPAPQHVIDVPSQVHPKLTNRSSAHEKIALYRSLFRGREDVFAKRWEKEDGKAGYSPACRYEWVRGICNKPCSKCSNPDYIPVSDAVIRDHLSGKETIGAYPYCRTRPAGSWRPTSIRPPGMTMSRLSS